VSLEERLPCCQRLIVAMCGNRHEWSLAPASLHNHQIIVKLLWRFLTPSKEQ
jgi:hypothetical protein